MEIQSEVGALTTPVVVVPTSVPQVSARVLHVINGEHYSGAERVQDLLACELPNHGIEVGFACVKPDRFPTARRSEVSLFEAPMRNRFDLRAGWKIAELVRAEGYQLIHAHTPRTALVGQIAARLTATPMVYHVHSPTSRDSTNGIRNWFNALNERISLRQAAALIAVSNSLGEHMRAAGFPSETVTVVPNGVPCPTQTREATPPTGEWTLGTVALFRPRKGLEVLLEALAMLRQENVPVKLRAVGPFETPEYEQSIRALVESLHLESSIEWTGFTEDVAHELRQLDVFVLPSLFGEGLPMVVLEAMAAGVPVVATRVEGVPEAIIHGESGVLADPEDSRDLAAKIRSVVEGEVNWETIRSNALTRHQQHFSDRTMAEGVASVYRKLLGGFKA